jgi:hypothetical protein
MHLCQWAATPQLPHASFELRFLLPIEPAMQVLCQFRLRQPLLVLLAVSSNAAASCAYCGKGAWAKSNRPAMTRAYPPSWFTGRMASLTDLWNEINQPQVSSQLSLAF